MIEAAAARTTLNRRDAARIIAKIIHCIERVIDGAHNGLHVAKKLLASRCQGHATGGAIEQTNAQVLLKQTDRVGQAGWRDA